MAKFIRNLNELQVGQEGTVEIDDDIVPIRVIEVVEQDDTLSVVLLLTEEDTRMDVTQTDIDDGKYTIAILS